MAQIMFFALWTSIYQCLKFLSLLISCKLCIQWPSLAFRSESNLIHISTSILKDESEHVSQHCTSSDIWWSFNQGILEHVVYVWNCFELHLCCFFLGIQYFMKGRGLSQFWFAFGGETFGVVVVDRSTEGLVWVFWMWHEKNIWLHSRFVVSLKLFWIVRYINNENNIMPNIQYLYRNIHI